MVCNCLAKTGKRARIIAHLEAEPRNLRVGQIGFFGKLAKSVIAPDNLHTGGKLVNLAGSGVYSDARVFKNVLDAGKLAKFC